jgi:hypothetical protein
MILVAGGVGDPNVAAVRARATARGVAHVAAIGGGERWPRLRWSLDEERLTLDGEQVQPGAVFVRFDVFSERHERRDDGRRRAAAWYYAVLAWALAHPDVVMLNRAFGAGHLVKPNVLLRARAAGLDLAETVVTNDPAALAGRHADRWIVKPVDGGAHTETLRTVCTDRDKLEGFTRAPSLLQERLVPPDLRVYRVGEAWFAFTLEGDAVDYRVGPEVRIEPVAPEPALVGPLTRLTDSFGLDFAAADFKRCAGTGAFRFLEVNSAPMFAAFDRKVEGAIADAIVDRLVEATP